MRLARFCRAEIRAGGLSGFSRERVDFSCVPGVELYPLPFAVYLFRVLHFNLLL